MKRFDSKLRQKERKRIDNVANRHIPTSIVEENSDTMDKLISGKPYVKEDIINCAKILLPKYQHDFDQQFALVENFEEFGKVFEKFDSESTKAFFVVFGVPQNGSSSSGKPPTHWVLFCLIPDQNAKITMLYKDPVGILVSLKLEEKIKEKIPEVAFVSHTRKELQQQDDYRLGPICLRNLKIVMEFLQEDPEKIVEKFPEIQFCTPKDLTNDSFNKLIKLTNDLSKNKEFKTKLKEFIDNIPLELGSGMAKYRRTLVQELEKDEENVDLNKIKEAREKYLNPEHIAVFQNNYELIEKEAETKNYELNIQKEFPEEMKKLQDILRVLDNIKVDQQLFAALENISHILDIDYNKMKTFYESKIINEDQNEDEQLNPENIGEIAENLPTMKKYSTADCTPLEQLLVEIILGMDEDDPPLQQSQEDIRYLQKNYLLVKEKYEELQNWNIQTIHDWATKKKGNLGTTVDELCETIAIMERAFNLLNGGFRFRDPQILAVLVFFHSQSNQGRLCQIQTGEGKTVIVSLLAVIKALQGHTVDVITSNSVLAAEGVKETKTFYSIFNLTVANNNVDGTSTNNFKICYSADVLYGTISNFQFDYLKDSFEATNIRRQRRFGQVILDEVDSMLVDNGGHIAKLATPYPGMESLRYIYIKIWQELFKAEVSFTEEGQAKIKKVLERGKNTTETKAEVEEIIQETIRNERRIIKQKIRESNPTDSPLIPAHLKDYVSSKVDVWLKNALHAKYNCHEHQQYRIITDDTTGEKLVVPVDYLNTGVTLKNTIWSNGLHQFIQLKHNLHLTFESLTSSFISNIGYIKKYKGKNIFGLTGTLGSRAEQELLSSVYNVNYAKLPPYKQKRFEEIPGLIVDEDSWHIQLTLEAIEKIDEKRAVLVICETESDLLIIKKNLNILQDSGFSIRTYANEDDVKETKKKVKIGDIILATNIAGRGTNFKTSKDLEKNGGLHVCVGFLPCNRRVEEQAFGRTSRQGNSGTAQLIIRQTEVDKLVIQEANPTFTKIKRERSQLERERLREIKDVLVKELNFKDELFEYFSELHRNLKKAKEHRKDIYALHDLTEFWAFWLEKKNFKGNKLGDATPKQQFDQFKEEAQEIINGTICHNPFYCVSLADYYMDNNKKKKATAMLKQAIKMSSEDDLDLLAGAHLKLFEVAIANGGQLMERLKKALAKVIFIDVTKNEDYKQEAITHLNRANAAIKKEINYIEVYFTANIETGNRDFENILIQDDEKNLFLKHIYSRLYCLKIHEGNIDKMIDMIQMIRGGVDIDGVAPTTLENLEKMDKDRKIKDLVTSSELTELKSIGIDAIYSLREVYDVPSTIIHTAQAQFLAGVAALTIGACFFPIFPLMSVIGGTLISEAIVDITMQLIKKGNSEFNESDFIKGKVISYGISLITFGISAITQSVSILSKAMAFCRKLSSFLRRSPYLKTLCNKLASLVDRLEGVLEKLLSIAKFNKLTKVQQLEELSKLKQAGSLTKFNHLGGVNKLSELQKLQMAGKLKELTRTQLFVGFMKQFSFNTAKSLANSIAQERIIKPLLSLVLKDLTEYIKHQLKKQVISSIRERKLLMRKLQTTPIKEIYEAVDEFLAKNWGRELAKDIGLAICGALKNSIIDFLTTTMDSIVKGAKLIRYSTEFAFYMENKLIGVANNNNVDVIIEEISTRLGDEMFSLCFDIMKNNARTIKKVVAWIGQHKEGQKTGGTEETLVAVGKSPEKKRDDPYSILGLSLNAPLADVNRAFRRLALQLHPDKNPNDPDATQNFQMINNAYDQIKNSHNTYTSVEPPLAIL